MRLASRALPELVEQRGESAFLAVWGNRGPAIVRWEEGDRPVTVNVRVGSVMPVLGSAIGRVFLAYLPEGVMRPVIAAERSGHRGLDPRRLAAEVRAHGMARVQGDLLPGVAALSAPIFDHGGGLAAALTFLGAAGLSGLKAGPRRSPRRRLRSSSPWAKRHRHPSGHPSRLTPYFTYCLISQSGK